MSHPWTPRADEYLKTIIRTLLRDNDWGSDDFEEMGLADHPLPVNAVIERARWLLAARDEEDERDPPCSHCTCCHSGSDEGSGSDDMY